MSSPVAFSSLENSAPARVDWTWLHCPPAPESLDVWWGALSRTEQDHAASLRLAPVRRRFIYFRGALRRHLGERLGLRPPALQFTLGPHGKPSLAHPGAPAFNLTHSGDAGLLAVTNAPAIGVDLEDTTRRAECLELAERFFAPAEVTVLRALPPEAQIRAFFTGWVRKEAWIKALGTGLATPLDAFTVSLDPACAHAWMLDPGPTAPPDTTWTFAVPGPLPAPHLLAALAVQAPAVQLHGPHPDPA